MELNHEDQSAGYKWFFGAGIFAVLLSFVLATVDFNLSTSKAEQQLGEKLKELRTAQTTLGYGPPDAREGYVPAKTE